ncbi:hypothetical protein FZ029_32455 [Azospirillum sp. Sh1]|nr:hypothetical protein FZ029_32455 [Azospirillum sp. Sh1]
MGSVANIQEKTQPSAIRHARPVYRFPLMLAPMGERVRVRGTHSEDSWDSHAMHPPHPDPLPGGEREISSATTPSWASSQRLRSTPPP